MNYFSSELYFLHTATRLFWLNQRVKPFLHLSQVFTFKTFLATFYLILRHSSIQTLTLQIHSFKPFRYTCESNNWYNLWKSTKVGVFLILQDFKFTRVWTFYYEIKALPQIFLRKIERILHDNFSVCSLNTKSFCHGLTLNFK